LNVIAAGKAARGMADAFMERYSARVNRLFVAGGGHPIPNVESVRSGDAALALADANRARGERLVVLLSGGASAMMAALAPGITLDDKIAETRRLLESGLPIAEINAARKRLSAIKGGKLALRAGRSITFAISDVHAPIEDDPAVIGSGPAFLPEPVEGVETQFVLAGSRRDAMAGASAEAARLGYEVRLIEPPTLGEAQDAAKRFVALAFRPAAQPSGGPAVALGEAGRSRVVLVSAGETTVRLPANNTGRGGRNQEFALAAAIALAEESSPVAQTFRSAKWALASIGTDGVDGPTDAAGAIVDDTTLARAHEKGLDAAAALQAHDSYSFFDRLGDLVVTGPTGTNVGDLQILVTSRLSP
jgi:hydroxypyruvate reductase